MFETMIAQLKSSIDSWKQGPRHRKWDGPTGRETRNEYNGLIDVIGGLETAINIAQEKAKLEDFTVSSYPKSEKKPWELILEAFNETKLPFFTGF